MRTASERFWIKVEPAGFDECWLWTAATDPEGYGRFNLGARGVGTVLAHRWSYEQLRTDIPAGLVLDHLCRTPACVNPWHLEPVTNLENVQRGDSGARQRARTHCLHGHEYTEENTYVIPSSGGRCCRTCKRNEAERRQQRGAQVA